VRHAGATVHGSEGYAQVIVGSGWRAVTRSSGFVSGKGKFDVPHDQAPYIRHLADWLDDEENVHPCHGDVAYHGFEVATGILDTNSSGSILDRAERQIVGKETTRATGPQLPLTQDVGVQEIGIVMNPQAIRDKFGDDFVVTDHTFKLGINHRFTAHFAERFQHRKVLETCTGAGFTTISLARVASHVTTVEISPSHQEQARLNIERAGLSEQVTFVSGDILDEGLLRTLPSVDAVFLDPDWADTQPGHQYRFINSNTRPPADALLNRILSITKNVALVLPPQIDTCEFSKLPTNEREKLYLGESHELYCLYFGELIYSVGETDFRVAT